MASKVEATVDDTVDEFVESVVEHTVAGSVHTYPSMAADVLQKRFLKYLCTYLKCKQAYNR